MVMTYNAAKRQFRKAPDDEIQNAISEVAYLLQYDRQIA